MKLIEIRQLLSIFFLPIIAFTWWCGVTSFTWNDHAIYIGVLKLEHQEQDTTSTLSIKIFTDDLQNALKNEKQWQQLPKQTEICSLPDNALQQYFEQHLEVLINGEQVNITLTACEIYSDVHQIQFTFNSHPIWNQLAVKADFLMELFPTQSNVLQVYYTNAATTNPYFGRMTKGKETLHFEF